MGQVIKIALVSDSWEVLTLAADTMNYNYEVFSVLHPFADSLHQLYLKASLPLMRGREREIEGPFFTWLVNFF